MRITEKFIRLQSLIRLQFAQKNVRKRINLFIVLIVL